MKSTVVIIALATISFGQICFAAEAPKPVATPKTEVASPERILPDGVDNTISINPYTGESGPARKGTVAAMLSNVALLNKLLVEAVPSAENRVSIQKAIEVNTGLLPSLRVIGVFDLFSVEEWIDIDDQPGRVLTGVLYLQRYPQDITPELKTKLEQIQKQTKVKLVAEAIAKALRS